MLQKLLISIIILIITNVNSQNTIKIPVTYYDFHSDRSNPEFEQPFNNKESYIMGMLADTLDEDGKPLLGNNPERNVYVKYWFRDFYEDDGAMGDSTIPDYRYSDFETNVILTETPNFKWFLTFPDNTIITALQKANGKCATWPYKKHYLNYQIPETSSSELDFFLEWYSDVYADGDTLLLYDTSFKNIVIEDSLEFSDTIGNGVYSLNIDNYFPLDNKGFGNEWNLHDTQYVLSNNFWAVPVSYYEMPDSTYYVNNGYNNISFKKVTDLDGNVYFIDLEFRDTLGTQISKDDVNHNYSFTSEVIYTFLMQKGMFLNFKGVGEFWVYINDKLVLDLGGAGTKKNGGFSLDTLETLQVGELCKISMFFAQRHSPTSELSIETNMLPFNVANSKSAKIKGMQKNLNIRRYNNLFCFNSPFKNGVATIFSIDGRTLATHYLENKDIGETITINRPEFSGVALLMLKSTNGEAFYSKILKY